MVEIVGLMMKALSLCKDLPIILEEMVNVQDEKRSSILNRVGRESGTTSEAALRNLVDFLDIEGEEGWRFGIELASRLPDYLEDTDNQETVSVITVPSTMRANLPATVSDLTLSTRDALSRVVSSAENELLVLSSYSGPGALEILGKLLAESTKRGVWVTYISQPKSDDYDPTNTLDTLGRMIARYGDPSRYRLLYLDLGADGIMHVKMVIADRKVALIGSANLTGSALFRNIEAGVIVYGRPADVFSRTFESLADGTK